MTARAVGLTCMLASAVASAAPLHPSSRFGPKGRPSLDGTSAPAGTGVFLYAGYTAVTGANYAGAGALIKQGDPGLAMGDSHTLGEIGVISGDQRQIVEIGWHVDPLVNDDVQPRLFVFHWIDGQGTCYDGCGFVQVSSTMMPGMRVTPGETAAYAIELRGTDWWLSYKNEDLGYFPGSLWPTPYLAAGYVQWFGEIAAASADSCTEMGNGRFGTDPEAAAMSDLFLFETGGARFPANAHVGTVTNPGYWNVGQTTPTSFAFGGPGQPTGCCTPTTCADSSADCGSVPDRCGAPLACGGCPLRSACEADFTCGEPSPLGEAPPPADDSGCCGAGHSATAILPALGVALLSRRRRRRVTLSRCAPR